MAQKYFPGLRKRRQWYEKSGEFRAPKRGEFYLSGAIPEVYLANNDLSIEYNIMLPVKSPPKKIEKDGFVYTLLRAAD